MSSARDRASKKRARLPLCACYFHVSLQRVVALEAASSDSLVHTLYLTRILFGIPSGFCDFGRRAHAALAGGAPRPAELLLRLSPLSLPALLPSQLGARVIFSHRPLHPLRSKLYSRIWLRFSNTMTRNRLTTRTDQHGLNP